MNLKKGLLKSITMVMTVAGIVSIGSMSQATIDTNGKILKINNPTYRASGYAYQAGLKSETMTKEQHMWKIYEYNTNGGTIKNLNNGIYCLKMGVGFGSSGGSATEERKYTIYADMKNPSESDQTIINSYKTVLPDVNNYNSIVWILDHCYVPAPSNSPTQEQITTASTYRKELLTNAGIPNSKINDDLIDIIQQIAIWYFTNDDQYKADLITTIQAKLASQLSYDSIEDVFDDWDLVENDNNPNGLGDIYMLYNYFIEGGKANINVAPSSTATNPITFTSSNAKVTLNGNYYIAGPYKIEEILDKAYVLEGSLTSENGANINYTLLDSNKEVTTKTLDELEGQDFYIRVDSTSPIEKSKFKVTTTLMQNTITYWTVANSSNDQPVAEVVKEQKEFETEATLSLSNFDLSLRKFITNIDGKELKEEDGKYSREPNIDLTPLVNGTDTTALYKHPKDPVGVSVGDIVIYTLRIYNEGDIAGYASSVTDYLPPQLEFVIDDEENFNAQYGWQIDSSLRKATTTMLTKPTIDPEDTLIKAFNGTTLDYQELKIKCRVKSTQDLDKVITNIAEITDFTDANGNVITDRDSSASNIVLPSDENLPDYKGNASNKSILTDKDYFYKGQEDDDDFEKLILEEFDLALRKFITAVNDEKVTNRIPVFTNVKDKNGNYIYEHTKEPIEVDSTDIVEYTIRIYNEGDIAGYAKEVKDDIPEGLEFLPNDSTNTEYRWIMLDKDGNETQDVSKAKFITTDYLSKEQEKTSGTNLIEAFDSTRTSPDYREVKVAFKVVALNTYQGIITNIAQISDDSDEEGKEVEDIDSTPNNDIMTEDDIDVEHIKLSYFDLALRKFITAVDDKEITNRVPVFKIDENGKYVYEHTKEPVEVENGNIVTYTLRIFNEGTKAGYAKEVKDDLPEGLEFLPDNKTNTDYRWVMLDENGKETEDITKAVSIKTDYLSKEQETLTSRDNLLDAFDKDTMEQSDYRDIKIAFKVTEPNTSDRILINKAQISNDSDKEGKDVVDIDSTPDKWIEGEDDQDIEKVKVKYFDLALRKWVTEAIIIENGKQTVNQTGHKAEDDPEEVVKVELKESQLKKVVVKFRYKIRITNEGEIAGYATEISDYIPDGLKFVAADNPQWSEVDGKIVTHQLKDTLLQPGDTAEVEVLLTWINAKDNFGLKVNVAEISEDKNDSDTPDIDSTPNNKKPGEDDIDDAPVILTIKTGSGNSIEYITLVTSVLGILTTGVVLIKKYVL